MKVKKWKKVFVAILTFMIIFQNFGVSAVTTIPVTGVTLDKLSGTIPEGENLKLTAIVMPTNATNKKVVWTSSDERIAKVDQTGQVTAVAPGSTRITATTEEGSKRVSSIITVSTKVKGISLNIAKAQISKGGYIFLKETVTPTNAANKKVTWTSSNTQVATVDATGKVIGIQPGVAIIKAKTQDGGYEATSTITVIIPTTMIKLDKTAASITKGKSITLVATVGPNDATNKKVTWKSSNTAIATVDATGKVTAISLGNAIITVTTENGGRIASCAVAVVPPIASVVSDRNTAEVDIGKTIALLATVYPTNAMNKNITWSSSNPSVATVDALGKVTAVSVGSATITVTTVDGGLKAQSVIKVINPVTGVNISQSIDYIQENGTYQFLASVLPSNATKTSIKWSSSDEKIAKVDANGLVTAMAPGTCMIIATSEDGIRKAARVISVTPKVQGVKIDRTSVTMNKTENLQLKATVMPSSALNNHVIWTSSNTSVATVDITGKVTAVSVGNATIIATTQEGGFVATSQITVVNSIRSILLDKTKAAIKAGQDLALVLTITPIDATNKNIIWSSSNTNIAVVDSQGVVTGVSPGIATISAVAESNSNKKVTCVVTVTN
ncbi:Ig-like domain-containing protein [Clostridium cellulovorans]|uniref:Ig domain protein group 2 domain protein n=1 Tax=Clostridium cellulovorans (strain ATCC 35296 / DSM 3052 / OCM 3 / 743B) TaxID=573061 RepID=D9SMB5_CLOC7|nr:Ig-like domain-containing protein [Clostridium cellulovorans]ADL53771.1 Ig domain protein group 2 domain protein [Clostridium cellulovorans 743B]